MPSLTSKSFPIADLHQQLTPKMDGDRYWQAIEQLTNDDYVAEQLRSEFPFLAEAIACHDRRSFMRILSASLALAGITSAGCRRWPVHELRPHTTSLPGSMPGIAEYYAALFELGGVSHSLLAKSYDGRPIKIEGNPDHPASGGAASAVAQASVLDLYDPDRSRGIVFRGQVPIGTSTDLPDAIPVASGMDPATLSDSDRTVLGDYWKPNPPRISWDQFAAIANGILAGHRARQGEGLAILVLPESSPTQQRWIGELKLKFPKIRWFAYESIDRDAQWAGTRLSYGQPLRPVYDLAQARLAVCICGDPLGLHPNQLQHARDWAKGRDKVRGGNMNRLVCIEPSWTLTGAVADTRLPLAPSQCELAVWRMALQLGIADIGPNTQGNTLDERTALRIDSIAAELRQFGSQGVVIGGAGLSAEAHQMICAINESLGANGKTIHYVHEPLTDLAPQGYAASIQQLSQLLEGNVIQTLVILGGNPLYDAPSDAVLDLRNTNERPLVSIHLSSHDNETSQACTWHVPMAHALETWSDGRAWDGTYTLGQPLIEPIFGGKSSIELLGLIGGQETVKPREEVRQTFAILFTSDGNRGWEQAIHDGFRQESTFSPLALPNSKPPKSFAKVTNENDTSFEVQFAADVSLYDGRFANNAWLQELPDPLSKLTWDNAAWVSPADAQRLKLEQGQIIRVQDTLEIPVIIMPGQAVGCITLLLGYGRTQAGRVGNGVGINVYPLRSVSHRYALSGVSLVATSKQVELATTQLHHVLPSIADVALASRLGEKGQAGTLIHEATLEDYVQDPHAVHGAAHVPHAAPLFDPPAKFDTPHRWAMSIDLNKCIGCGGCVIACQAENNIPVVGKENVLINREMHWIRIDRYFKGTVDEPDLVHVPVACVHCENAPCEQVCPVAATVHDAEGTNTMVYNRCIGTRYCANNCPFKVRRFNYFDYQATDPREPAKPWVGIPDQQQSSDISTLKKMVHNPDVTVRMRGVMEKCTYCIQRITTARIAAKNEFAAGHRASELVSKGELQTACQATCPTRAIVFGDLNDTHSQVSEARADSRNYEMLAELNLGARTTYLAKIRNRPS